MCSTAERIDALFPGRMPYKATTPGSVDLLTEVFFLMCLLCCWPSFCVVLFVCSLGCSC